MPFDQCFINIEPLDIKAVSRFDVIITSCVRRVVPLLYPQQVLIKFEALGVLGAGSMNSTCWHKTCTPMVRHMAAEPPPMARFMGQTWGPSGADRTQMGPMLAPWTLLFETQFAPPAVHAWMITVNVRLEKTQMLNISNFINICRTNSIQVLNLYDYFCIFWLCPPSDVIKTSLLRLNDVATSRIGWFFSISVFWYIMAYSQGCPIYICCDDTKPIILQLNYVYETILDR